MTTQAVFYNKVMNITERVNPFVIYYCTSCDFKGVVKQLASKDGFSCCPECNEFDVRVQNNMVNFNA